MANKQYLPDLDLALRLLIWERKDPIPKHLVAAAGENPEALDWSAYAHPEYWEISEHDQVLAYSRGPLWALVQTINRYEGEGVFTQEMGIAQSAPEAVAHAATILQKEKYEWDL